MKNIEPTIKLVWDRRKKTKGSSLEGDIEIVLYFPKTKERKFIYTKISCTEKQWNPIKEELTRKHPDYKTLNKKLTTLKAEQIKFIEDNKQVIDLRSYNNPKKEKEKITFNDYCLRVLNNQTIQESTKVDQLTSLKVLNEYNDNIQFDQVIVKFIQDFDLWLRKNKEYQNSNRNKIHRVIRKCINVAISTGKLKYDHKTDPYYGFKMPKVSQSDTIYLTPEEIRKIQTATYKSDILYTVKDMFLILCYTGLRVSDLRGLTSENFITLDNRNYLDVTIKKTGKKVLIPLNPALDDIIIKYDGDYSFKDIPDPKFNKLLKVMAKQAGINQNIKTTKIINEKKIQDVVQKWELVCSHTGRRSFATNAHRSGVSDRNIMKITGHSSSSSFDKYIRSTTNDMVEDLSNHPFFQNV